MLSVLEVCHSSPIGGHHSVVQTGHKILQCGYYWPIIHQRKNFMQNVKIFFCDKTYLYHICATGLFIDVCPRFRC